MRLLSANAKFVSPEQSKRRMLAAGVAILCSASLFGAGCGTEGNSTSVPAADQKPSAADEEKARKQGEATGPAIQAANDAAQEAARKGE
ncbi:MAG: hypothetical protein H8F28_00625 [Fibrella sp.]|nr:hypothetical protein [Armatimonadota bacterium]